MRSQGAAAVSIVALALTLALATRAEAEEAGVRRAAEAGVGPEFCPALRALVDAAGSGFVALRGAPEVGADNAWAGTRKLPGASECTTFGGTPPAYVCTLYLGDVEEKADGAYDRAVAGTKDCLAAGWKATEKVDGVHARTTVVTGTGPSVRVVSRDVSGDAYLVELWVDAPRR
jgi:hypothetical protein